LHIFKVVALKLIFENKTRLVDPSNPPLFVLAIKQIDGFHSQDIKEVAHRYAGFVASNLQNIYSPLRLNDVLSGKLVCEASKILTPHFQLSRNNLHSYRLRGIDLVGQIADILSVSVTESINCELKLVENVLCLLKRPSGIQIVNNALKYQVHKQQPVKNKFELIKKLREHGDISIKYCPSLFLFNFLVKYNLQITVPLSLNFTSKLPLIYQQISLTRPTTQRLLKDSMSLRAKKELLKSTFSILASTKLVIQNTVPENKAIPPLFYVSLSKCRNYSKLGFQESMATKRPFQGGNTKIAVFRLKSDVNQIGIYFESAIKMSLSSVGVIPVKKNSDHYKLNYNSLLMAIFNVLNNDENLSNLFEELHLTSHFYIQKNVSLHYDYQPLQTSSEGIDKHLPSEAILKNSELSQSKSSRIDRSTLDSLISLVKANCSQFGLKVIIQHESS